MANESNITKEEALTHLENNYTKPGSPIAFSGISSLLKYYKGVLTGKEIAEVLFKFVSYSRHKETHKIERNPFFIYKKRQQFQIDLVDVAQLSKDNNGIKYLLTCIDVFTRKAFVRPLKTKKAVEVSREFSEILRQAEEVPKNIFADKGSEIKNATFRKLCRDNGIKLMHAENEVHGAYVERFNRSLQVLIHKYLTEKDTSKYIDKLQDLVDTYNSRYHRMIQMSPDEGEKNYNQQKLFTILNLRLSKIIKKYKNKKPKFKVGEHVRIKRWKYNFNRIYQEQFSEEVFKIVKIQRRKPIVTYSLQDLDEEEVDGTWYENELSKADLDYDKAFKIEKIIKRKTVRGKDKVFVKWRGYDSKFNSWVDADQVK